MIFFPRNQQDVHFGGLFGQILAAAHAYTLVWNLSDASHRFFINMRSRFRLQDLAAHLQVRWPAVL